jgi:hypothetical protein
MEGLDGVQRRVWLEIELLGHQRLTRFRALHSGGNTPTSCLVSYSQHTVATRLLKLFGLEEEEEGSDLPSLRVQAPLYRRGPGYRLGVWLPGYRLLRGRGLDMGPLSPDSLSDDGNFIKCLSPLDRHLRGICPVSCLRSFRGEGSCLLIGGDGRGWCHACPPLLSILSGPGCFWQSSRWRSCVVFTGWQSSKAAGPSVEAGLSGQAPWRFLGRQPADGSTLGLLG